ncbi:hypothetical protein NC99_32290 [Sunxiuqinia dokdonensis]|uniref:Uncharacterized protein n=1 Tax=Sunxiuqinia dokdonensis TaxID=1409788 RepID=A0A0L8V6F2_9BACT|nr:hypothetical protein NC99_32290 [Sunxiuqinia dokdonensis]
MFPPTGGIYVVLWLVDIKQILCHSSSGAARIPIKLQMASGKN